MVGDKGALNLDLTTLEAMFEQKLARLQQNLQTSEEDLVCKQAECTLLATDLTASKVSTESIEKL